ncbi:hypothetical protein [Deinococcus yavapaiensis]|uniref:Uncharacterized protein n=1 Tax=Deinococcus yavapaiensis KR-236 TaxID=694435 RepID=A0A318SKN9_9DEIO|nr:hypothetical protein [Deinococcus yavapaiensis]PYE54929.1 hypothetical protein DES52_104202 [Deinococcus yavapaiensis KR-236]
MRWVLVVLALAIAALAYFFGLRLGYVSLTPTYMFNAQGVNNYSYRTYDANARVILTGRCETRSGVVALRLYSPSNRQVASALCTAGNTFALNLQGGGEVGYYVLNVEFDRFTGMLEIDENRAGETGGRDVELEKGSAMNALPFSLLRFVDRRRV